MGPEEIAFAPRVMIVAAHPDDEVIGAGGLFEELGPRLRIVFVTNGAPAGTPDADLYAATRYGESLAAAALAGIRRDQFRCLNFTDQQASLQLPAVTARLAEVFAEFHPSLILTHPYEGGHPDHDATAFGVHAAAHGPLWEFTSYHAGPDGWETGVFLPGGGPAVRENVLSARQRARKRSMFAAFATQQEVLRSFGTDRELYRPALRYDFTQPPHAGRLNYENYDWGMTGRRFCELATAALEGMHVTHDS